MGNILSKIVNNCLICNSKYATYINTHNGDIQAKFCCDECEKLYDNLRENNNTAKMKVTPLNN